MATDGDTDYRSYAQEQLEEALRNIDRARFPINYERLTVELERRRLETQASVSAGAEARNTTRYPIEFKGSGEEYFRIWIVNLALTVVTLGIYSAWAKVRRERYFYGNTFLAGSAFGYHGEPLKILKGRIIAVILLAAYFFAVQYSLAVAATVIALIGVATPWLVVKSRMFASRVTSWRGLRFDFKEDYAGAYRVLLGWLILGMVTLGLLMPRFLRERYRFLVTRTSFGTMPFDCNPGVGRFYRTAFGALGLAFAIGIPLGMLLGFIRLATPMSASVTSVLSLIINYVIIIPVVVGYTQARNLNEVLNHTTLGPQRLHSKLRASTLIEIYFRNIILMALTLGLYMPWAQIRLARYRFESIELEATDPLDQFVASNETAIPAAVGEEISSLFDLDFGF